ncbi:MAG: hypothetical protein FJZ58_05410 [Chlamydiae bacterium]|nr:hypothetical protein [Chlamydiota bacterium]
MTSAVDSGSFSSCFDKSFVFSAVEPLTERIAHFVKEHALLDNEHVTWFPSLLFPLVRVVQCGIAWIETRKSFSGPLLQSIALVQAVALSSEVLGCVVIDSSFLCSLSVALDVVRGVLFLIRALEKEDGLKVLQECLHIASCSCLFVAVTYGSTEILTVALLSKFCFYLLEIVDVLSLHQNNDVAFLFYTYTCFGELLPHILALYSLKGERFSETMSEIFQTFFSLSPSGR